MDYLGRDTDDPQVIFSFKSYIWRKTLSLDDHPTQVKSLISNGRPREAEDESGLEAVGMRVILLATDASGLASSY